MKTYKLSYIIYVVPLSNWMLKLNLIIVTMLLLTINQIEAKPYPETEWTHLYGTVNWEIGNYIQETEDQGYIAIGIWSDPDSGAPRTTNDIWLLRLDPEGNLMWDKKFGGGLDDSGNSVKQTRDGGFIVAGTLATAYYPDDRDAWLIKTDSNGQVEWQRRYGNITLYGEKEVSYFESANDVRETPDGGYIFSGTRTILRDTPRSYFWVVKTDESGNEQWNRTISKGFGVTVEVVKGSYVVSGYNSSGIILAKLSLSGDAIWTKSVGQANDSPKLVYERGNDLFIVGSGTRMIFLIRTDNSGEFKTRKQYDVPIEYHASMVQPSSDNGLVFTGYTGNTLKGFDVFILKLNTNLDEEWVKIIVDYSDAFGRYVQETSDGGYIIIGESDGDLLLLKLGKQPVHKATECTVWTTDTEGVPVSEYEGWMAYIHWVANGYVDIKVYAPDGSVEASWEDMPDSGSRLFTASQKIGVYRVECTGASPHYIGKSFFIMPESELGIFPLLTVMLFALTLHLKRRE